MSKTGLDSVKSILGSAAAQLPDDLANVPDAALMEFSAAVATAKAAQSKLLEKSADHSLRLVPALLRPVVRRVLFG